MKVDGNCLCGHITYKAEVDPEQVFICHCTDCQTHAATAFSVAVGVVDGQFDLVSGQLKFYEKIAASGTVRALAFCPECGTRIYAKTVGDGTGFFGLRLGTVRQRKKFKPKLQVWHQSALDWVGDLNSSPKMDQQPSLDGL